MKFKPIITCLALLTLSATAWADLKLEAVFAASDPATDGSTLKVPSVQLYVLDPGGLPAKKSIDKARSGALTLANWSIKRAEAGSQPLAFTRLKPAPSSGDRATELTAHLPADNGDADFSKEDWHLLIAGTASAPALTLVNADGTEQTFASIDLVLPPMEKSPIAMLKLSPDFDHQVTLGGGEDGSIFALALHYNPPPRLTDNDQLYGLHFDFDGTFTPDPNDALKLYGKVDSDAGFFRSIRVGPTDIISGSLRLTLDTHFESDQKADNYNWTVGAGVWGFLRFKPMTLLSKGLYSVVNLGQSSMTDSPILTLFAGYDYVASSELDATAAAQGDQRLRFRARYRTPLWRDVDLPLLPTVFDVDGVADFSGIWDFDHSRVMPEIKASIEFMPRSVADNKLAFAITYVSGKISPTFVDEDAFLAGLRWRF